MRFANAGHMVPLDKPENALDMLNRFLITGLSCKEFSICRLCQYLYTYTRNCDNFPPLFACAHVYLVFIYKLILHVCNFLHLYILRNFLKYVLTNFATSLTSSMNCRQLQLLFLLSLIRHSSKAFNAIGQIHNIPVRETPQK